MPSHIKCQSLQVKNDPKMQAGSCEHLGRAHRMSLGAQKHTSFLQKTLQITLPETSLCTFILFAQNGNTLCPPPKKKMLIIEAKSLLGEVEAVSQVSSLLSKQPPSLQTRICS